MIAPAQNLVIVGSGLAAWTVVRELRKLDAHTSITLVTRDNGDFYSKPMLSNALSSGKTAAQLVSTTSAAMAEQHGVKLMAHTEVTAIDPVACTISTSQGTVAYSRLVLALGADAVRLPLQGDAADRVLSVNDLQDYAAFRERLQGARRVTVIGAGLIGCEFANDLVAAGYEVDVVDPGTQPLGRLLPPEAGDLLQRALSDQVSAFTGARQCRPFMRSPETCSLNWQTANVWARMWCCRLWVCARAPRWHKQPDCKQRKALSSTASCRPASQTFMPWAMWPKSRDAACPTSCRSCRRRARWPRT